MDARKTPLLIGWAKLPQDSHHRRTPCHFALIVGQPPAGGDIAEPIHWPLLLRGLEHGQTFYLDSLALDRARTAAARFGLHLRPEPARPFRGLHGTWHRLTGYRTI